MERNKKESYMHYQAKQVMLEWLRDAAQKAGYDNYASIGKVSWRVNRQSPLWGVFDEYPIHADMTQVWDETIENDEPPIYEWMCKHYGSNFKIADIVIQHKGSIMYIIEIVHKNEMSEDKIRFYKSLPIQPYIIQIPAHWILGQIDIPKEIPLEFFV